MGDRWVLHLDMDAFFASCEQLTRPTLRGRPVLVGGMGPRGVVAGASYEARGFGARSAMPMHQARRLVGFAAVVLPPRFAVYSTVSQRVFEVVREGIPVLEQLSLDEAFGEPAVLVGADSDAVQAYCEQLKERVLQGSGLIASIGAGSGKQVAKIASGLAKPDGITVIRPREQQALMAALPVRKLWGIGPVADERLRKLGIETIGALAEMAESEAAGVLGKGIGPGLHRLARGLDNRPVAERGDAKQISAERTFQTDLVTVQQLREAVASSGGSAHVRLLSDGRGARTVVLKLRKSDMSIITRSATLPYATVDRDTLIATAARLIIDPMELGPIRLVGVGFAGLSTIQQGSLFPDLDRRSDGSMDVWEQVSVQSVAGEVAAGPRSAPRWGPGSDLIHEEFGYGWVQGAGHGVLTVRFETRTSGPGRTRTFAEEDPALQPADPVLSLDWD